VQPYADLSRPPLSEPALRRALVVPDGLWTDVRVARETGSTNADVMAAARTGAAEGLVIVAERQVAGRGRLDRRWHAPPQAALTLSVLLRPPPGRLSWLPLLAGVALVDMVRRLAEVDAALKWPNDLLVRAPDEEDAPWGKCAGILAEAGDGAVVVGIGLNVLQRADELPPPPDPAAMPPTSLALVGAALSDRAPLLKGLLRTLADHYRAFTEAGGDPVASGLVEAYRDRCATIGQEVTVTLPTGGELRGHAYDVDADGRLVVVTGEGTHALAAGDVRHVR
jgi:BirA family transcriptional regulator, biotin operon repressor / biotin---[acetyl-CoA-carboxylase] ligase